MLNIRFVLILDAISAALVIVASYLFQDDLAPVIFSILSVKSLMLLLSKKGV
jgi:hypothetical protein